MMWYMVMVVFKKRNKACDINRRMVYDILGFCIVTQNYFLLQIRIQEVLG